MRFDRSKLSDDELRCRHLYNQIQMYEIRIEQYRRLIREKGDLLIEIRAEMKKKATE